MRAALSCLVLLTLPACALFHEGKGQTPGPEAGIAGYARFEFASANATAEERAACKAVGGNIAPSGKLQRENCVQPFADGGESCSGDADCVGECRYEGDAELAPGSAAMGTCQVTDARFGCNTVVENGKIAHTLCVD